LDRKRTAIISDLHGNLPALEVALDDVRKRDVDRIVCLGDVIGYGAKPRECLEIVMELCGEREGFCLLGNHEQALLESPEDFNPSARAAIEWTRDVLNGKTSRDRSNSYWDFLGGLVPEHSENGAQYAHGSPRDPVREYMLPSHIRDASKMRANFECMSSSLCFVGHSHVPAIYFEDGKLYRPRPEDGPCDLGAKGRKRAIVNVGSVGQPRDGDTRLSYAVFDGRHITFVRLEYDVAQAQADIRSVAELPEYLATRLGEGR
jgi:predicted phosphodiesterase